MYVTKLQVLITLEIKVLSYIVSIGNKKKHTLIMQKPATKILPDFLLKHTFSRLFNHSFIKDSVRHFSEKTAKDNSQWLCYIFQKDLANQVRSFVC